jgi:ParB/RepB/Spo0J family partition protein
VKIVESKKIHPNRLNPRLDIDVGRLNELADSIKQVGLLEPIIVRPHDGEYEVVVGERRYRAAQQIGLMRIPVIIRDYSDDEVIELNLVENTQREDLSAVEKGNCCKQLMEKYPEKYPTKEAVSRKVGFSTASISEWLELMRAPEELRKMVAPSERVGTPLPKGKITYKTAVRITRRIKEPERQVQIARELSKVSAYERGAQKVISKAVEEPEKPIGEIVKEVIEAPYELPFRLSHLDPILKGTKTQTSRKGIPSSNIREGATIHAAVWEPNVATLKVTSIRRKRLGDFTEEDAKKEGGYTLAGFRETWKKIHGNWNGDDYVYVIGFERVK